MRLRPFSTPIASRPRPVALAAVLATAALVATGCGGSSSTSSSSSASPSASGAAGSGPVTIAAFNFGESQILANMYKSVLDKAGYQATVKSLTNREVVEPALEKGDLDVVAEYVGTLTDFLNKKDNGPDAASPATPDVAQTATALRALTGKRNLTVLTPSPATDQNAFAVTKDFATKNKLTTLSDLSGYTGKLSLGGPPECPTRPRCQPGLEKTYGLKFADFKSLDAGGPLTKQAIKGGQVDIGLVFSSDGGIDALGLQVLTDDKKLQTADNLVPVVRTDKAKEPLIGALNKVSASMSTDELVKLNKRVDVDREDPATVAKDFLKTKGLA
jgi:osmoprotectant transport system substrate-binding protein